MCIGSLGGLDDGLPAGAWVAIGDVGGDRVLKQDRFLRNDANLPAQASELQVTDVLPVDPDGARVDIPEPGQQAHERGLAAAVGPDQGDGLTVVDGQADPLEQGARSW